MAPIPYRTKVSSHPGSSKAEIRAENASASRHRYGNLNGEGRQAGTYGLDDLDDPNVEEFVEGRTDFKGLHDAEHSEDDLFTVRDVVKSQVDWQMVHPGEHPISARYVLAVSEDEIKNQRKWPVNIEKAKKEKEQKEQKDEKKAKQEEHKQDKDLEGSDSGRGSSIDSDEEPGNHNDKDEQNAKDQEYKRNRQGGDDERSHDAHPAHDEPDSKSDLSSQEQHFLHHLQEEAKHMANLKMNDGKGKSPLWDYNHRVEEIDEKDQNSPDNWIPRSTDLIRLTGNHPLNAEPNLQALFKAGLITPNKLHYVRNHGPVPRLNFETHRLHVFSDHKRILADAAFSGLEDHEHEGGRVFTMAELSDLDWINIPVALACDGNRRKELNMIKRSKGFNWGSGGISNAYWKGPTVKSVFEAAGFSSTAIQSEGNGERLYVHFEGSDELSEGSYATSIPLDHVMDPCNDVLLAQFMNDVPLHPDHGYPLRLIIPGFVGGRCVKWLEKMWISNKPSENYYHIWDNRVLPTFVTEKDGPFAETMFRHPDTACMEQNLNSAIVHPAQGEQIDLSAKDAIMPGKTYRIEGYAYEGGGHMVQKVEISLDRGKTWLYAYRRFPEHALRHGWKFWTWCHWYCDVKIASLVRAEEISVRAWNVFKNTQPDAPTWNIMGMMNNCVYRVRPELQAVASNKDDKKSAKKTVLTFRHPCESGTGDGGWMQPSMEIKLKEAKQAAASPSKQFTGDEIRKHNTKDDCWLVINETVYDATSVLDWHPGGAHAILGQAGKVTADVSDQYNSIHDDFANHKLQECAIGTITDKAKKVMKEEAEAKARESTNSGTDENLVLKAHAWTSVRLSKKKELSKDSRTYTFEFPSKTQKLGLPPGKHVLLGFHFEDKMVFRAYTPTRPVLPSEEDGSFDVVVKTYFPTEKNPGGTLSNVLDTIKIGEHVDIRGPTGDIEYLGNGTFLIESKKYTFKTLNLVGGGSGVTPHYQLIHRICLSSSAPSAAAGNQLDKTKIVFIYANSNESNILMRDELDGLAEQYPDTFTLVHVLSHPTGTRDAGTTGAGPADGSIGEQKWTGETGHVDQALMQKYFSHTGTGRDNEEEEASSKGTASQDAANSSSRINSRDTQAREEGAQKDGKDEEQGEHGKDAGEAEKVTRHESGTFMCGPPPMIKAAHDALLKMGYEDEENLFAF